MSFHIDSLIKVVIQYNCQETLNSHSMRGQFFVPISQVHSYDTS
uniref:Uncharacterized protein n=1 Tax=Dulem virus 33 TaxID=3145751 RepID=A0AAU8B7W5_9CAUD